MMSRQAFIQVRIEFIWTHRNTALQLLCFHEPWNCTKCNCSKKKSVDANNFFFRFIQIWHSDQVTSSEHGTFGWRGGCDISFICEKWIFLQVIKGDNLKHAFLTSNKSRLKLNKITTFVLYNINRKISFESLFHSNQWSSQSASSKKSCIKSPER